MSPAPAPVYRFFIRPQYSLYYRRVNRLDGADEARSDYTVILVLAGRLKFSTGEKAGAMSTDQALLLGPASGSSLTAQSVELLQLNL